MRTVIFFTIHDLVFRLKGREARIWPSPTNALFVSAASTHPDSDSDREASLLLASFLFFALPSFFTMGRVAVFEEVSG